MARGNGRRTRNDRGNGEPTSTEPSSLKSACRRFGGKLWRKVSSLARSRCGHSRHEMAAYGRGSLAIGARSELRSCIGRLILDRGRGSGVWSRGPWDFARSVGGRCRVAMGRRRGCHNGNCSVLRRVLHGNHNFVALCATRVNAVAGCAKALTLSRVLSPSCPRTLPGPILPWCTQIPYTNLANLGEARENIVDCNIFWGGGQKRRSVLAAGFRPRRDDSAPSPPAPLSQGTRGEGLGPVSGEVFVSTFPAPSFRSADFFCLHTKKGPFFSAPKKPKKSGLGRRLGRGLGGGILFYFRVFRCPRASSLSGQHLLCCEA
jgi:hypothetical protein